MNMNRNCPGSPGQSGEARIFLIQDDNLTAEVPLRRSILQSILQSTLRQKYRSTGRHNPQRDGGPEKGLYRLHPIALGYRRSDATYDVVGVWNGAFFRLDDHIRRFRASMEALHMKPAESEIGRASCRKRV